MNDNSAIGDTIASYYRAFSTLEMDQITPYFHEPVLLLGPGGLMSVPDSGALASILNYTVEDLRSRGYGYSEFETHELKRLNSTTAWVRGVALRFKKDGEELERVGLTYLLHESDDRWRIAVMIIES